MEAIPAEPVSARHFMEEWLPRALAAVSRALGESAGELEVALGVRLAGEEGGEWVVRWSGGGASVTREPAGAAGVTLVQSVEDWRGALWEGRGGGIGRRLGELLRGSFAEAAEGASDSRVPSLAGLAELSRLDGVVRVVVTDGPGGDWVTDLKLGPGETPAEPSATLRLSAEDADALGRGEIDAFQAVMTGRVRVSGDMVLLFKLQALATQIGSGGARPK